MGTFHSEAYRQFLKRLRAARLEAGLTQLQVAEALSQHQSWVSKCESGERRVDVIELAAFAKLYHCPLDSFLPIAGTTPSGRKSHRVR